MADIVKIKDPPYDRYALWRIFSYLPNKLSDSDNLQKTVAAGKPRRIAARVSQGKAALLKEQNDVGRMILNIGKVQPWALLF